MIYKRKGELKEFEKQVNSASANLCLRDASLLNDRGQLLALARKKVADDGYVFKKGHSRSKVYGVSQDSSIPKRPKYNQEMRESRIEAIDEELDDIQRILQFKQKRLVQAETAKKYAFCEQLTMEMKELRDKKRELEFERKEFVKKGKRAKKRQVREMEDQGEESSDVDADCHSSSSRSVTPSFRLPLHLSSPDLPGSSREEHIESPESHSHF